MSKTSSRVHLFMAFKQIFIFFFPVHLSVIVEKKFILDRTVTAEIVCDPVTGIYWVYLNTQKNRQKAEKRLFYVTNAYINKNKY